LGFGITDDANLLAIGTDEADVCRRNLIVSQSFLALGLALDADILLLITPQGNSRHIKCIAPWGN
jgi:hypothetical protein